MFRTNVVVGMLIGLLSSILEDLHAFPAEWQVYIYGKYRGVFAVRFNGQANIFSSFHRQQTVL